jgi:CxxC motif-containing protein (DUF1111 family)
MRNVLVIALLVFTLACVKRPTQVVVPIPPGLTEAPTGYDTLTNGFTTQAQHNADRAQFEEDAGDELGPLFNHRSCLDCHSNPVSGGNSQVFEHRTNVGAFLVHDQAIPGTQQQVAPEGSVNALRSSLNLFGDSLVEQVPDSLLRYLSTVNGGEYVIVGTVNGPRVGRFGHKDQHANLLDFAGDADFNEKGVGNRLHPDPVNGIEDQQSGSTTGCKDPNCEDIDFYASFMRGIKAPPRGTIDAQVTAGGVVFMRIGCGLCHVPTLYTEQYVFHPFGDFLLHDVATGDSVAQGDAPANKIRTAPLWGLRVKSRFLHDGRMFDIPSAIRAHGNEANRARDRFQGLNKADHDAIIAFLNSL